MVSELEEELTQALAVKDNKIFYDTWEIEQAFESLARYVERKKKYGKLWNDSRFKEIDVLTEWFIAWNVYTIWAYSNIWKSRFTYWEVCKALELWKTVCYFSLEEMKWIVLRNLICCKNEIKPKDLYWDNELKDCFLDQFRSLSLYDSVFDIGEIESIIKRKKPDYVFIDFIQNVQTKQWWGWYEKMSHIAKQTQRIAIQNKCVLVQLSQVSNEIWKQLARWDTDFVTLKWAWELFASSDVIFILYKGEFWEFFLHIAKNKYGQAKDEFSFDVDRTTSKFTLQEKY